MSVPAAIFFFQARDCSSMTFIRDEVAVKWKERMHAAVTAILLARERGSSFYVLIYFACGRVDENVSAGISCEVRSKQYEFTGKVRAMSKTV